MTTLALRLALAIAAGYVGQRVLLRGRGGFGLAELACLSLSVAFAHALGWFVLIGWLAGLVVVARFDVAESSSARGMGLVTLVLVFALVAITPETPLVWDEHVLLTKAKLAALGILREIALTPGGDAIPPGYPIGYPFSCAALGGMHVTAGAAALRALCVATFLSSVKRHRPEALAGAVIALVCTPLVWVHLRLAYVDLPIGLLAASLLVELHAAQPSLLRVLLLSAMLTTFKDEGLAYVAIIALVAWVRRPSRACVAAVLGGLFLFAAWRIACWHHHVVDVDHALGRPELTQLGPLLAMVLRHLLDLRSFGALWPVVAATLLWAIFTRRFDAGWATLSLLSLVLLASVVAGPPQVREFALSGTLFGRLLLQLAPLAALVVAPAWCQVATAPRVERSG